ncbi:DNA topology modulation protein FlaR [Viridibacillus sp. NPDC096237]|uniref:DNA topology modulation protein FlaR n=1 Tax=Viridibacillus sp. NPDC096237 TaxID=3390721 RepID=UPI003D05629A
MNRTLPKKIHIIGSVGSGKTTLAKELSAKLAIPYHELDNVVWKRCKTGDIRRTVEEREDFLSVIIMSDSWIIEGVHTEAWVANNIKHAEIIIFLDTSYKVRIYRIFKRFILQKLKMEQAHYKPTFEIFLKMIKWNRYFEEVEKPNFFTQYEDYWDKFLIVSNKEELNCLFELDKK